MFSIVAANTRLFPTCVIFVWKKATMKFEEKLQEKIDETYQQIQVITNKEDYELF